MSTARALILLYLLIDAIKSQLTDDINEAFTIANGSHPNIIFILTDDWGMNDVGWTHDNTDTLTPYLDNLAKTEGLILTNYYAERVCTASRASFLTGRYPSHLGLQSGVCAANQPASLTRQVSMLSNEFQSNGYNTHLIGKWHLGMMSYEYTPTYRGFDTFYGFWAGGEDYFNHRSWSFMRKVQSTDLFINDKPALYQWGNTMYNHPYDGIYGVYWQKAEALKLLQTKILFPDRTAPFFFYFAMQASHSPRQAPTEYTSIYINGPNGDNNNRVTFQAQTTSADDAIKDIVEYLKRSNLWNNTLVIITSDNGAKRHYGDNAPYRGFKNTSWEGGVKVPGFVTGGYLSDKQKGKILSYPMHIVDWYPTLLSAAGLDINYERSKKLYESEENFDEIAQIFREDTRWDNIEEQELDGIDLWDYINGDDEDDEYFETEREILLDLKDVWCPYKSCGALRIGHYKYIRGNNIASLLPDYDDGDKWFRGYAKNESKAEQFCYENKDKFERVHNIIDEFTINSDSMRCVNTERGCLFDLELDPCEHYDLSMLYPDIVNKFENRLNIFQDMATTPLMGENNANELFGKEVISPLRVCHNREFWCPFKKYKDVAFEYKLYNDKKTDVSLIINEEFNGALTVQQWIIYVIIPSSVIIVGIGFIIYCFYKKKKQKKEEISSMNIERYMSNNSSYNNDNDESDIINDISEVQPLKQNYDGTVINLGNGHKTDYYGSTTIK